MRGFRLAAKKIKVGSHASGNRAPERKEMGITGKFMITNKLKNIVNSSRNAEKLEDFCDQTINMSRVLNDYMLKNIKD